MSNLTRTTVLLLLIMEIAGCGSSEPECGSSTTTAIVTKIAKDNAPNKLTRYVMQRAESAPPFCDLISGMSQDQYNHLKDWVKVPISQTYGGASLKDIQDKCTEHSHKMEAVMDKSVYSLSTIRMETRDLETKRVTCEGKLSLDIPDVGGAVGDIAYQVENTADGQLYVTISDGLQ